MRSAARSGAGGRIVAALPLKPQEATPPCIQRDSQPSGTAGKIAFQADSLMAPLNRPMLCSGHQARRAYRLIDAFLQPHPHLDGRYESIEEAISEAIGWLAGFEPDPGQASIGLEVSTSNGDWRTIRQPMQLLCPLPSTAL